MWPDTAVEENNLNHNVSVLRKALGRTGHRPAYIETVPRVGYRFVAPVEARRATHAGRSRRQRAQAAAGNPLLHDERRHPARLRDQRQRAAAGEGVELAHAPRLRVGQPDLAPLVGSALRSITASSATTSAAMACRSATSRRELRHLGPGPRNGRRRGGARSVSRCSGSRAARRSRSRTPCEHPERVSQLVLYGGFAAGLNHIGTPAELEARRALAQPDAARVGAEQPGVLQGVHLPVHPASHARARSVVRRAAARVDVTGERRATHGGRRRHRRAAAAAAGSRADARHPLRRRSRGACRSRGRELAASIPGARYVSLPSANHLHDGRGARLALFLEELGRFLGWDAGASSF